MCRLIVTGATAPQALTTHGGGPRGLSPLPKAFDLYFPAVLQTHPQLTTSRRLPLRSLSSSCWERAFPSLLLPAPCSAPFLSSRELRGHILEVSVGEPARAQRETKTSTGLGGADGEPCPALTLLQVGSWACPGSTASGAHGSAAKGNLSWNPPS